MNPPWLAAEALLALILECLGVTCDEYSRVGIDTSPPVADCSNLTVVIGPLNGFGSSCPGNLQYNSSLEIYVTRCCEPVGALSESGGYTPPSPEQVQAAAACVARDAWAILACLACQTCILEDVDGVTICCDEVPGVPSIRFQSPQGGCRTAVITIPLVYTVCC